LISRIGKKELQGKRSTNRKTKRKDQVRLLSAITDTISDTFIEKVNREVFALIGDVPQMAPAAAETTS